MLKIIVQLSLVLGLLTGCSGGGQYSANGDEAADKSAQAGHETEAVNPFQPSDDAMADVDATIARASVNGKLAMIVLGANWCHDSRGLIAHFDAPDMAAFMDMAYETHLVDVGLLEHGQDIIKRFGMPVIYGTPTVLIIDPMTMKLINADNEYQSGMHRWRDADSISIEDTLAYFTAMAESGAQAPRTMRAPEAPSPALVALYAEIDAFETHQAQRISRGYDYLRPLMAIETEDRPKEFMEYWVELRGLRYGITDDLIGLRAEARARTAANEENIVLTYPEYARFSWE